MSMLRPKWMRQGRVDVRRGRMACQLFRVDLHEDINARLYDRDFRFQHLYPVLVPFRAGHGEIKSVIGNSGKHERAKKRNDECIHKR